MPPVLVAEGQVVGERRGRNEEIHIADLLSSAAEAGILLTPDPGNGIVNAEECDGSTQQSASNTRVRKRPRRLKDCARRLALRLSRP